MDAFEAIRARRSVRRFQRRDVPRAAIEALVDAARLAPSAGNAQPWEFVAVTNRDALEDLGSLCDHGAFLSNAPACVAVFCRQTDHYLEDGCAAVQNLLIAAAASGLGACWIGGAGTRYAAEVAKRLKARGHHRLVALVAVGYPPEELDLPPTKRLLSDVLHWEEF